MNFYYRWGVPTSTQHHAANIVAAVEVVLRYCRGTALDRILEMNNNAVSNHSKISDARRLELP